MITNTRPLAWGVILMAIASIAVAIAKSVKFEPASEAGDNSMRWASLYGAVRQLVSEASDIRVGLSLSHVDNYPLFKRSPVGGIEVLGIDGLAERLTAATAALNRIEEAMRMDCRLIRDGKGTFGCELYSVRYYVGRIIDSLSPLHVRTESFLRLSYMDFGEKVMVGLESHWAKAVAEGGSGVDAIKLAIAARSLPQDPLVKALLVDQSRSHSEDRVRENALRALANYDDEHVWQAVIPAALRDPSQRVRQEANSLLKNRK